MRLLALALSVSLAACAPLIAQPMSLAEQAAAPAQKLPSRQELELQLLLVNTELALMKSNQERGQLLVDFANRSFPSLLDQQKQLSEQLKKEGQ